MNERGSIRTSTILRPEIASGGCAMFEQSKIVTLSSSRSSPSSMSCRTPSNVRRSPDRRMAHRRMRRARVTRAHPISHHCRPVLGIHRNHCRCSHEDSVFTHQRTRRKQRTQATNHAAPTPIRSASASARRFAPRNMPPPLPLPPPPPPPPLPPPAPPPPPLPLPPWP